MQGSAFTPDGSNAQDVQEAVVVLDEGEDQVLLRDSAVRRYPSVAAIQGSTEFNLHHAAATA